LLKGVFELGAHRVLCGTRYRNTEKLDKGKNIVPYVLKIKCLFQTDQWMADSYFAGTGNPEQRNVAAENQSGPPVTSAISLAIYLVNYPENNSAVLFSLFATGYICAE